MLADDDELRNFHERVMRSRKNHFLINDIICTEGKVTEAGLLRIANITGEGTMEVEGVVQLDLEWHKMVGISSSEFSITLDYWGTVMPENQQDRLYTELTG